MGMKKVLRFLNGGAYAPGRGVIPGPDRESRLVPSKEGNQIGLNPGFLLP